MKIAISAQKKSSESNISELFGKSPYFIIFEIKGGKIIKIEIIENKNLEQISGSGVEAAKLMMEKNVNIIITGNMGPRSLDMLNKFDVAVYCRKGRVDEALKEFIKEKLT